MSASWAASNGSRVTSGGLPSGRSASAPMNRASPMRARFDWAAALGRAVAQLDRVALRIEELALRPLAGAIRRLRGRDRERRLVDLAGDQAFSLGRIPARRATPPPSRA